MAFTCPRCNEEFYERLMFCPKCGLDFRAGMKRCPRCRADVPTDSRVCENCGLDFERWAMLVPRVIVLSAVLVILVAACVSPWLWKAAPWLHDKGRIVEGLLQSDVGGEITVPMFINWKTGERYIEMSSQLPMYGTTDYMNQLIPLPPEVIFHYDVPLGEKVWIIRRVRGSGNNVWVQVGRWIPDDRPGKYGWLHASNVEPIE